jgi:hypothetical protein
MMTPEDNELRMQVGLVVTHTDDELLFVRSEKYGNTLDALQSFAELVRQDEREACAKLCDDAGYAHEVMQGSELAFELAAEIRGRTE